MSHPATSAELPRTADPVLNAVRGVPDGGLRLRTALLGRKVPPGLAGLFQGLAFQTAGADPDLMATVQPGRQAASLRLSCKGEGRTVLHLRPGLLQTPAFGPTSPWVSGTVAGGARSGHVLPAAAETALAHRPAPVLVRRAEACAARLLQDRLGGTAWADAPDAATLRAAGTGLAVVYAPHLPATATAMLHSVLAGHQAASTLVVLPGAASASMAKALRAFGCRVLHGPVDPWPLIDLASSVHVAGSPAAGFLALLAGKQVHCHAPGWYAGWGVTVDAAGIPARAARRSVAELAAGALLLGTGYADPFTGQPTEIEAALDQAAEWRRLGALNRTVAGCVGMQFWKRRRIGQFLHTGARPTRFLTGTEQALAAARPPAGKSGGKSLAAWWSRLPPGLADRAAAAGIPMLRVEDGFIRSRGLGSDFLPPCSIILDGTGIYYDPSKPSDLETLLAGTAFDPVLLDRARAVMRRLVQGGITKYGADTGPLAALPSGRRLVLVPGQVADDLSVKLGGAGIATNAELLRRVRQAEPDAYILYKPHPDVEAGHRPGAMPDAEALRHADQVVRHGSMAAWIEAVDTVHTLTSLAGFEALLRGRRVVAWGQPFYAGWGLTTDMAPLARRVRRLRLEELAAGVLLLYPRYVDPVTGLPCPAEVVLDRLADARLWRPSRLTRLRRLQGRATKRIERWLRPAMPVVGEQA